jgi:DNA-binding response OmpR family regulator
MLDIDMPDLQGDQVLKRLRKMENYGSQRAAVIMVTSMSDQAHVMACLSSGCDAYIAKPFNAQIIDEKLACLGLADDHIQSAPLATETVGSEADSIFKEIQSSIRTGRFSLPALPQIGVQFRELIDNNSQMPSKTRPCPAP